MKSLFSFCGLALFSLFLMGCQHLDQAIVTSAPTEDIPRPLAYAWPFLEPEMMVSRGGSSQGSEVTLATEPDWRWIKLQEPGHEGFERDRLAILAMEGSYRTSFQFTETAGFIDDYSPSRPYFSWGTEHVSVIEDTGTLISLQHTLVMYFEDESGKAMGPMVMKHWRQDWTYQDTDLHTYRGNKTWARKRLAHDEIEGAWSQAVFQVDDSPRYEVIGRWEHGNQLSAWSSLTSHRPLPRREYSVRDDYNVLAGEHRITIVPTGWVHEQHNRKLLKEKTSETYVAQEIGVNRYERITEPDLDAAEETWVKTAAYWETVRDAWRSVFATHDIFQLKGEIDEQKLWQIHFAHASEIEESPAYDSDKWTKEAEETIHQFLNTGAAIETLEAY
ncbi:MAG: hypothetical protein ACI92G_003716 [Candidatus Pelagisphaera sp.]|jgi:hypothetical protein